MVFTSSDVASTVFLQGPFWQADVEVVQLASPVENLAFRNLWLERHRDAAAQLYLPGTAIVLGCVRRVTVTLAEDRANDRTYRWVRSQTPTPTAETPANISNALATGELVLLLVQADPQAWPAEFTGDPRQIPPLTCLAGDIPLEPVLNAEDQARERLYRDLDIEAPATETQLTARSGPTRLRSLLSVHGSGLSLYGGIDLPWQSERLLAPFQLAQTFGPSASEPVEIVSGPFRLTVEVERLIPSERQAWIATWQKLSQFLTPRNPLNDRIPAEAAAGPHWVTLEVTNPATIPNLYWEIPPEIRPGESVRTLKFPKDSFSLILSNQSPYELETPPTSLGRTSGIVTVLPAATDTADIPGAIVISLETGIESPAENYTYQYRSEVAETVAETPETAPSSSPQPIEIFILKDLTLAFDPVAVPSFLRQNQGLPLPTSESDTFDHPLLWGFMPLERGWFQLPVPNLSEQVYLDNGLARPLPTERATGLIQGAVALGNDDPDLLAADYPDEQPWNLVLTNADYLQGTWTLNPTPANGYRLSQVVLKGAAPELVLNGLFWLSTSRPLAQDALPNLDNWVSGLRSHPLRTVRDTDLFPAAVEIKLATLSLSVRTLPPVSAAEPKPVVAELGNWSFSYEVNGEILSDLVQENILPANTFSQFLPWVWQHHGTLPMVQALPLTQTLLPPNYPSPNRQLVPFELGVKTISVANLSLAVPDGWQFTAPGAGAWLDLPLAPEPAAREWGRLFDLPLVSLSLPGLALDPQLNGNSLTRDASLGVGTQYRFDLPYTDEPNALTQLPEPPQDPEAVSPLPDSPLPEPPEPLLRDTFVDHWQQLSTKASLASADAVVATSGNQIQALVEPFTWPVVPNLDLSAYPGKLTLTDQASTNDLSLKLATADEITLEGLSALEGISGKFSQNGTDFNLVAGSLMAAGDATGLRDQRGVTRSASRVETSLIKTPISLQLEPTVLNEYDLTTTRQPLALTLGNLTWQLWFRDLPIQRLQGTNPQFSRQHTQSAEAEDVNDPNALGREHNLLTGYEWRLGETDQDKTVPSELEFLSFFGLHFYPLTLETLTLAGEDVQTLQLIGRLQLPLSAKGEPIPDFSSDVQITFERRDRTLVLTAVAPATVEPDPVSKGIWPLALENNETTNAPQVTWGQVTLQTDSGLALEFKDVWLKFFLFDSAWALPLDTLIFPAGGTDEVLGRFDFPAVNPLPALDPRQANLTLRLADAFQHSASLQIDVHLGEMAGPTEPKPTFKATLTFSLTPSSPESASPESIVVWDTSSLFDQLPLVPKSLQLNHHALEFEWSQARQLEQTFQFLPGMPITTGDIPGFAALTFNPKEQAQETDEVQFPDLELATAFLETILSCQWGDSLQTTTGATPPDEVVVNADRDRIFNSSAGDMVIGYTTHWVPPTQNPEEQLGSWDASLLLNGFLEVKNLISWPLALQTYEEAETENAPAGVVLPALPVASDNGRALSHLRHGMRVMLNQHRLPVELLTLGTAGQVFEFGNEQPWELLAVTEHQLLSVFADSAQAYRLGEERRWTTTQAVRLMSVDSFKAFLSQGAAQTIAPTQGVSTLGQASLGLWHQNLQSPLTDPDSPLQDPDLGPMLMVEASAPHWVRTNSVVPASPTTLQVLPNGSQLGILSNPEDYGPSDPQAPHWLLLTMPFLGRLLNPTPALTDSTNPIQRDPVDLLAQGHLSDLSLALTSWAETEPAFLTLAGFDTAAGRTWARLDPLSLEESWFRLNNPLPEAQPGQLQSILAALPSTPARLSRSTALDYAFDPQRLHYPPATRLSAAPASAEDSPSLLIHPEISRTAKGLQALYTFQESDNPRLVRDVSGVDTPLDLTIADISHTDWIDGGGLRINEATLIQADQPALKIIQSCRATNELTIEAWIRFEPEQVDQRGPARIVTLSNGAKNRYFTLGHEKDQNYVVRLRVEDATDSNGLLLPDEKTPPIATNSESIKAGLTHLAFTRQANGEMRFFINGQEAASNTVPNNLFPINQERGQNRDPDQTFRFALANETTNDRPWLGEYRLVAIYNRALTPTEVSTLTQAGLATGAQRKDRPYSWHQTALQLKTSGLFPAVEQPVEQISRRLNRHAAATLLPARLQVRGQGNPRPMSLSVSPYLGLEFQPILQTPSTIQLASVELLCLEAGSGNLRPVASTLLDRELLDASETPIEAISQQWATETHQRLTPGSAIAVLRYREILSDETQQVVTRYRFQVLSVEQSEGLAKRIFALRSPVGQQRFPSGQFGGCRMPEAPETFELAAPQTVGMQPLYLNQRPAAEDDSQSREAEKWPWGLSGLRLSVQYSDRKQPALGVANTADTLWWQTPSYAMQYRANDPEQPDLPTAGLPPFYRPGAIKTLLPVLPTLPMPSMSTDNWQPVLPGQLRYLLTGDRPGVMMAIRNKLLKQTLDASEPLLVSGSVPVQHRVPRPVALPPNGDRDRALQTWASYFEPERNLLATDSPTDEAFFADCGDRSAQRLLLQIQSPVAGAIPPDWDGSLVFARTSNSGRWVIQLTLVDDRQTITYTEFQDPISPASGTPQTQTELAFTLSTTEDISKLRDILASRAAGDTVTLMARIKPADTTDNFSQTLSFPLRVIDPADLALPLQPTFIHFEDPEYNRQLVSNAATATVSTLETKGNQRLTYDITLACDRQEYSPQNTLFLRYDWNDNREAFKGKLFVSRINEAGGVKPLKWPKQDNLQEDGRALPINSGILQPISLVELQAENNLQPEDSLPATTDFILNQGDILELTLKLTVSGQTEEVVIVLPVTVVTAPVIPVPQAAYGLLRSLTATVPEENPSPLVECVRFAWGPAASRIELVCAEDLRTGVVRRRAVFQWSDSIRPVRESEAQYTYAVQKITQTGSTHLPNVIP